MNKFVFHFCCGCSIGIGEQAFWEALSRANYLQKENHDIVHQDAKTRVYAYEHRGTLIFVN